MIIVEVEQIPEEVSDVPIENIVEILKVCQEMQILCEKDSGIGISAVQVGIPWKLFLIKGDGTCPLIPKGQYGYFVNCEYKPLEEEQVVSVEGCLSIRSLEGQLRLFEVKRYRQIKIHGLHLRDGEKGFGLYRVSHALQLSNQGVVFQHEADHHNSILISDIGKEVFIW